MPKEAYAQTLSPEMIKEIKGAFSNKTQVGLEADAISEIRNAFKAEEQPTVVTKNKTQSPLSNIKNSLQASLETMPTTQALMKTPEIINTIGKTMETVSDRPAAGSREAIRSNPKLAVAGPFAGLVAQTGLAGEDTQKDSIRGVVDPKSSRTFQDQVLDSYYNSPLAKKMPMTLRFIGGMQPSAAGFLADMYTNPFDMLTEIATFGVSKTVKGLKGLSGPQKSQLIRIVRNSDELKKEQKFMDTVVDGLSKAIRPTKTGKGSFGKIEKFNANAANAVDSILENADQLIYVDKAGEIVNQGKPKSLGELSQAIEQTKDSLFQQYKALQKQAGQRQAVVKTDEIVDALLDTISGREADLFIEDTNKVMKLAERLDEMKYMTLDEAENTLKTLNEDLKAYYRGTATSGIPKQKALVAKMLRDKMDDAITKSGVAGSQEYKDLRRKYGALKELEKDTSGRFIVAARQNPRGFFDLGDMFSGAMIAEGVITLNPASVAKGLAVYGVKKVTKALNNPNRIIAATFNAAEKIKYAKPNIIQNTGRAISQNAIPALTKSKNVNTAAVGALPSSSRKVMQKLPSMANAIGIE